MHCAQHPLLFLDDYPCVVSGDSSQSDPAVMLILDTSIQSVAKKDIGHMANENRTNVYVTRSKAALTIYGGTHNRI